MMKDELGGKIMIEFVALRAKMYAYKTLDESEIKKSKGTKKCVVSKNLTFDDYKNCLFDKSTLYKEQFLFENKKHVINTVKKYKIALNSDDDKRIVCDGNIITLARGYVN